MTAILGERDGIRYTALGADDLEEAAQLVAQVFTDGAEPITRQLRVGPRDFVLLIRAFSHKFVSEGLSVVARDVRTNEAVGAQLNDDMGTNRQASPSLAMKSACTLAKRPNPSRIHAFTRTAPDVPA